MCLTDGTDAFAFEHEAGDSFMVAAVYLGGTYDSWPFPAWTTNVWHHYAVTWDGANIRIFLDGVFLSSRGSVISAAGNWTSLFVGGGTTLGGPAQGVDGSMQDPVFYSAACSDAEIAQLYSERRPARRANLIAYYPLDPGTAQRLRDYSGNGNDLTAAGTPADGATFPRAGWGTGSPVIRRVLKAFSAASTGTTNSVGVAAVTGAANIDPVNGLVQTIGVAAVTGAAGIAGSSATQVIGSVVVASTSTLVASGVSQSSATVASMPSTATLVPTGTVSAIGVTSFALVMTPAGVAATTGVVALASSSSAAAVGSVAITGTANVAIGVAGPNSTGTTSTTGIAAVTSSAAIAAVGVSQSAGSAAVPSSASIAATGTVQSTGAATSGLFVAGTSATTGAAALTAAAPAAASGSVSTIGAAVVTSTASIAATGVVQNTGTSTSKVSLSVSGTSATTGVATVTRSAGLGTYSTPRIRARHPAPIVVVRKLDR